MSGIYFTIQADLVSATLMGFVGNVIVQTVQPCSLVWSLSDTFLKYTTPSNDHRAS